MELGRGSAVGGLIHAQRRGAHEGAPLFPLAPVRGVEFAGARPIALLEGLLSGAQERGEDLVVLDMEAESVVVGASGRDGALEQRRLHRVHLVRAALRSARQDGLAATTARDARCAAEFACPGARESASAAAAACAALQTGARAGESAGHAPATVALPRAAISAATTARVRSEAAACAGAGGKDISVAAEYGCADARHGARARTAWGGTAGAGQARRRMGVPATRRRKGSSPPSAPGAIAAKKWASPPGEAGSQMRPAFCSRVARAVWANSEGLRHVAQHVVVASAGGIGEDQGLAVAVLDRAPGHGMVERTPLRLLEDELVDGDQGGGRGAFRGRSACSNCGDGRQRVADETYVSCRGEGVGEQDDAEAHLDELLCRDVQLHEPGDVGGGHSPPQPVEPAPQAGAGRAVVAARRVADDAPDELGSAGRAHRRLRVEGGKHGRARRVGEHLRPRDEALAHLRAHAHARVYPLINLRSDLERRGQALRPVPAAARGNYERLQKTVQLAVFVDCDVAAKRGRDVVEGAHGFVLRYPEHQAYAAETDAYPHGSGACMPLVWLGCLKAEAARWPGRDVHWVGRAPERGSALC
eukprot:6213856-Pleurochrysis_carterae.AAC.2